MKLLNNNILQIALYAVLLALLATACSDSTSSDDDDLQEPDLYKLGEFVDNGHTVVAYSEQPLSVGFQEIYLDIHEDGTPLDEAHIHFNTMMHMEAHSHASPFMEPGHHRDEEYNLYKSWAIFTMPSGMMGNWELEITVHDTNHSGLEITGKVDVEVDDSNRVETFVGSDENKYILTWIEPNEPEVGINDLVVSLHKQESMTSFPAVTDATVEFEPWMPSMGHGSSNNVNPVHEESGFYHGEVNYNMTGDWELRFDITLNGEELASPVIELEF